MYMYMYVHTFFFSWDQVELEEMRAPLMEKLRAVEQEKEQLQRVSQKHEIYTCTCTHKHAQLTHLYTCVYTCV